MRIRVLPAATAVAFSLLTGCSPDEGAADRGSGAAAEPSAGNGPPAADVRALTRGVEAYVTAYFGDDAPTALGMMSERCRGVLVHEAEHAGKRGEEAYAAAVEEIAEEHGPRKATDVTVDEVSGDRARVSYRVGGLPEFGQEGQPWSREDGTWKYDAC
ncbi:hypothetical protein [Streptomyces sp. MJP52]|uniref:hypothetical protein n=1 Tax=Streptomyces sp. MJP52 TaxID=2940555 RepID=UPI002474E476|nr:hypothetical protein [Streptomyces sp. MJP52]MDH6228197.1 hypothetical protein [Streptomyces sp. MJP52]